MKELERNTVRMKRAVCDDFPVPSWQYKTPVIRAAPSLLWLNFKTGGQWTPGEKKDNHLKGQSKVENPGGHPNCPPGAD